MPEWQHLPIAVTIVVEVDGHRLEFAENAKATGGRGQDLEKSIRGSVDSSIGRAHKKAVSFIGRAWADGGSPQ